MIHDPTEQDVTCDGCGATTTVDAGSDTYIEREIEREGWVVISGKHFCEECAPQAPTAEGE